MASLDLRESVGAAGVAAAEATLGGFQVGSKDGKWAGGAGSGVLRLFF